MRLYAPQFQDFGSVLGGVIIGNVLRGGFGGGWGGGYGGGYMAAAAGAGPQRAGQRPTAGRELVEPQLRRQPLPQHPFSSLFLASVRVCTATRRGACTQTGRSGIHPQG